MSETTEPIQEPRAVRMVDMKIRLEWLLGVCGVVGWGLISTYFKTDQLVAGMTEVQIAVKAGNSSVTAIAGKQALTEFRQDNAETAIKRNSDAILILQQQRNSK